MSRDVLAATPPPQSFTYQGRLFQTNGTTPLTDTVHFTIEILDPSGSCLLYKEKVSNYNLSPTNGLFSINIGSAVGDVAKRVSPDPGLSMADVFSNTYDHTALGGGCASFSASTMAATARRKMRVTISNVTTGAAEVVLSPNQTINTTPYATVAESLQGYGPDKFIKATGTTTQAALDSLAAKSTELGLLAAQSTKLLALTNGATAGGVLNIGTPTASTDPVNKSYADGKLGGLTFDVTTVAPTATGQSIRYNQAANKWEVYTPSTSAVSGSTLSTTGAATIGTTLNVTGASTLTGNTSIGGNTTMAGNATVGGTLAVTGITTLSGATNLNGNTSIGVQKWLSLGSFNATQESTLTGSFTAADAGKVWYNSSTNKMMYFDGTSAVAVGAGGGGGSGTVTSVSIAAASNSYLSVATPSTTPTITLNVGTTAGTVAAGNDSRIVNAVQKDGSGNVALTGNLDLGGTKKITNAQDPSNPQDAATKAYVDLGNSKVAGTAYVISSLTNGDVLVKSGAGWYNTSLTSYIQGTGVTPSQLTAPLTLVKGGTGSDNSTGIAQNAVFAGPASGGSGAAGFRGLASTDIPSLSASYVDLSTTQTVAGAKTFSNNAVFNGSVVVGASTSVALDVTGGTRPGSSAVVTTCGLGKVNGEGTQRYNYTTHNMEYCNGSTWVSIFSSGGGSTAPPPLTSASLGDGSGGGFSCGINSSGTAYCWGSSFKGQVGYDSGVRGFPVQVSGGLSFSQITAGNDNYSCGVTTSGAAYCWGNNQSGQLGTTTAIGDSSVTPLPVVGGNTFTSLAAGRDSTCGITNVGTTYCWGVTGNGVNPNGKLGNASASGAYSATPVLVGGGYTFVQVVVGGAAACGLTAAGNAYCWGDNGSGALGSSTNYGMGTANYSPLSVSGGYQFLRIAMGSGGTACGVTTGNQVFCWGMGGNGINGNGASATYQLNQIPGTAGLTIVSVAVGGNHACALTSAGAAYCWGSNKLGQLGFNTNFDTYNSNPTAAIVQGNHSFNQIYAGSTHTCALESGTGLWCWGSNDLGQLGVGYATAAAPYGQPRPSRIAAPISLW